MDVTGDFQFNIEEAETGVQDANRLLDQLATENSKFVFDEAKTIFEIITADAKAHLEAAGGSVPPSKE